MISESKYRYVGVNGGWHLFVSRGVGLDREILCVQRARYLLEKGGVKIFDRIVEKESVFNIENRISLLKVAL